MKDGCVGYADLVEKVDALTEQQRSHAVLFEEVHEWMTSIRTVMRFVITVAKVVMFLTALVTAIYTGSKHMEKP
jgi:hypothetical protein